MKDKLAPVILVLVVGLAAASFLPFFAQPLAASEAEGAAEKAPGQTPENWAFSKMLWAALTMAFAVLGTSWAQSRIGVAGAGAIAEKPELAGTIIVLIAIPETMVILGFVISVMILVMT